MSKRKDINSTLIILAIIVSMMIVGRLLIRWFLQLIADKGYG